jgi:hypothetical protein
MIAFSFYGAAVVDQVERRQPYFFAEDESNRQGDVWKI